jgi:Bacterial regulatory protein, arsR family
LPESAGDDTGIDQRLLRLASEPLRLKTLVILSEEGSAGVSEIAEGLGIGLSEAEDHLKQMHAAGLVELAGEILGRGVIEPSYRPAIRVLWGEEEWAELDAAEQRRVSAWIVHTMYSRVCEALENGSFNARLDAHNSYMVATVDEEGWRDLIRIHAETLEALLAAKEASEQRLAERGEEGFRVISAMICAELPTRLGPIELD